jgi:hypothetical protein
VALAAPADLVVLVPPRVDQVDQVDLAALAAQVAQPRMVGLAEVVALAGPVVRLPGPALIRLVILQKTLLLFLLEIQARRAAMVLMELIVDSDLLVQPDQADHRDHRDPMVHVDLLDHQETPELLDHKDQQDQQDRQVILEDQDLPDLQEQRDHKDLLGQQDLLDPLDQLVLKEHQEMLALLDQEHQHLAVLQVLQELLEQQDHPETQGHLVIKVTQ